LKQLLTFLALIAVTGNWFPHPMELGIFLAFICENTLALSRMWDLLIIIVKRHLNGGI
jgi:hypothetical protein